MAVKKLTNGNDNFTGTDAIDDVDGLAGDDTIRGQGGNDILFGNDGNDVISGGSGNDKVDGGDDNDTLDGGTGDDKVLGGKGDDLMAGGAGNDTLNGNDGIDVLDGGIGVDKLFGDAGNDFIYGGTGFDTLYGGAGNDYLFGGVENDTLYGGGGSDFLEGGDGADILADTSDLNNYGGNSSERDEMVGGLGADTFYGGYDTMWGGVGNDTFNIRNQGIAYGGIGDDKITVTNSNPALGSWLEGGFGNDTIVAGAGNDVMFSGYGADTLKGGGGNDNYVMTFDNMNDTIVENAGAGIDTIYFIRDFKDDGRDDDVGDDGKELDPPSTSTNPYKFSVTLGANIENGVLDDQVYVIRPVAQSITYIPALLTGNELNNRLTGSGFVDYLNGAGGNDIIDAAAGDDFIYVGQGTDTIDGGIGSDTIISSVSFKLSSQATRVENIDLLDAAGAASAGGTSGNNYMVGNKSNNTLEGGAGDDILDGGYYSTFESVVDPLKATGIDTLIGGTGNDTYRVDSVDDKISENANTGGVDTIEFKSVDSTITVIDVYRLADGVENLIILDTKLKGVDGNNLNNRIIGSSAINILKGGYGDDYLDGATGVDTFEGGYGDDTFVVDNLSEIIKEIAGQGNDWVQSEKIDLDLGTQGNWTDIENARLTGTGDFDVTGRETDNYLIGNAGDNMLNGGDGIDTLEGGLGDDTYVVDTTTDTLIEVANEKDTAGKIKVGWIDSIQSSITFDMSKLFNFEKLSLTGSNSINGTGNLNDNEIRGNDSVNILNGLAGNDILDGAGGLDTLIGGTGNDTYRLSGDGDKVVEKTGLGEGIDTIEIGITFSLGLATNVENLTLSGTFAANGTGTEGDNLLIGNSASNILTGLGGVDKLIGGDGADTLIGGTGTDTLDLTETLANRDIVRFAVGDSKASANEADKVIKFSSLYDTLDLASTKIAATSNAKDGEDVGTIKSHKIDNGIIKFDDTGSFISELPISTSNLANAIDYLKLNITDQSTVAFKVGSDMWVFQDAGGSAADTLITLVGVTGITSLSTSLFGTTTLHIA